MEPILVVRNISKYFDNVYAVDDVSMEVYPGEVVGLLGDNGAGKSTLIKTIAGVHLPTAGVIVFEGKEQIFSSPREARELGIETIYQDLALAENLDIPANVFLGREKVRSLTKIFNILDTALMEEEASRVLDELKIEIPVIRAETKNLSGGQRQSVAIARAIYWNAKLLIMDEPMAALGVPEQRMVRELITTLRQHGVAIIIISHNLADIFSIADRVVVLRRGRKVGECQINDTTPEHIVSLIVGSDEVNRSVYA